MFLLDTIKEVFSGNEVRGKNKRDRIRECPKVIREIQNKVCIDFSYPEFEDCPCVKCRFYGPFSKCRKGCRNCESLKRFGKELKIKKRKER